MGTLVTAFTKIETVYRLAPGTLKMELMVETPQSIFDERGAVALPTLIKEGRGRITAAHFGTYDYTASLGITAAHQHMRHPACDFARGVMQVALAGTDVWLSDGATNVLPVGNDRATIHRAWRLHYDDIRHSLTNAFYQGWDLHPAQLVTRYAAVYAFFLESLDAASERLRNFIGKAAQATLVGEVFDDAATGQGLLNFFLRALNCGAVREDEIGALTGLTLEELRSGSFVKIVKGRRAETGRRLTTKITRHEANLVKRDLVFVPSCLCDLGDKPSARASQALRRIPAAPTQPESALPAQPRRSGCRRSPSGSGC